MKGYVDVNNRALMEVGVCKSMNGNYEPIIVLIDTAFDGHLVCSSELISEIGMETLVETEAILADGSILVMKTFFCFIDWFGSRLPIQVIANDGKMPLLGTGLLVGHRLTIDYQTASIEII